jgi:hypothetical protein
MQNNNTVVSIVSFFVILFLSHSALAQGVITLPRTGQSTCYDSEQNIIPCAGTGQDGDIQSGVAWPVFRFKDNMDGTMTDTLTGLMWPKYWIVGSGTWQECLDLVKTLNIGGHTDWRMPNINELISLFNPDASDNYWLIAEGFGFIPSEYFYSAFYASSTSYSADIKSVLAVAFPNSRISVEGKLNYFLLLPVRSGQGGIIELPRTGQNKCFSDTGTEIACPDTGQDGDIQAGAVWPEPRFQDNGDGTVTDKLTGLMWTKDANPLNPTDNTWQDSLDYVKSIKTGGYADWRLPNLNEMRSLIDYSQHDPALPEGNPFINLTGNKYWISTSPPPDINNPSLAWVIELNTGVSTFFYSWKFDSYSLWPVRGGYLSSDNNNNINKAFYAVGVAISSNIKTYTNAILNGDFSNLVWPMYLNRYMFFTQDGKFYSPNSSAIMELMYEYATGELRDTNPFCEMGVYSIDENGVINAKLSNFFGGMEIKQKITGAERNGVMIGCGSYTIYTPFTNPQNAFVFVAMHMPSADWIMQQIQDFCEQ